MIPWFDRLGQLLDSDDEVAARAYLEALGYDKSVEIRLAADTSQIDASIRAPDWDTVWWTVEEDARNLLQRDLHAQLGEKELMAKLSEQALQQDEAIYQAACRGLGSDSPLSRAAAGAGAMARYDHALASLAQMPATHVFMRKYRLVERGRWPLGVIRNVFCLY
ncbi:MAG: hypothetical protein FJY37_15345 [Betaproteobacteria bacterium]|nr:hypothetical protein [Betaproteobacteria bacterium]